jgi:hypothetical protein
MFSTKYPNNSRTVSGLNVPVFNTDVILAVNTTPSACSINLDQIPDDYWNTTWVLYVYDATNNATVNNITINAGSGQTINNSSTFTIGLNNGGVAIRILSNNQFIASTTAPFILTTTGSSGPATLVGQTLNIPQYVGSSSSSLTVQNQSTTLTTAATLLNFAGPGVSSTNVGGAVTVNIASTSTSSLEVQNQSTTLTTAATLLNFTGAGVSSSNISGAVTVNVPSGLSVISLTNAALLTLISNSTVVPGQAYLVTDAPYGCLGVLLQGITTKTVTESANANFYVADYQNVGNYSGLPNPKTGFVGNWTTVSSPVTLDNVAIFNNRIYQNLTGVWGTDPDTDTINWLVLSRSLTNGYLIETDFVLYNVTTNNFTYREDKRGNKVTNSPTLSTINDFPWGNNKVTLNTVTGTSYIFFTNSNCVIRANIFNGGVLNDVTPFTSFGTIENNTISSNGTLTGQQLYTGALITGNIISQGGIISYDRITSGNITNCLVTQSSTLQIGGINAGLNLTQVDLSDNSVLAYANCTNCVIEKHTQNNNANFTVNDCSSQNFNSCEISDGNAFTFNLETVPTTYSYKKVYTGYSNWEITLSALDVIVGTVLNIASGLESYGIFNISNATSPTITSIVNLPTNHTVTIKPNSTSSIRIVPTAVAVANTNEVIETASSSIGGGTTYTGRTNGCDEAILQKYGTLVGLTIKNIWI